MSNNTKEPVTYIYWEASTSSNFLKFQYDNFAESRKALCTPVPKADWDALRSQVDGTHRIENDPATNLPHVVTFDPEAEQWARQLTFFSDMDEDAIKSWLYSSARYRFVDDTLSKGFSTVPMISHDGVVLSVDGYTKVYEQYLGDEDHEIDSVSFASVKTEAKNYIRKVVASYRNQ